MGFLSKRMTHADGKMHHLGIDERDVAARMILTAGTEEVADIAALLTGATQTGYYREYLTYLGSLDGQPVGVMSSGHGCMPMAIAVEELNHLGVGTLIKVGVGASVQPGVAPGTIVIPTAAMRGEGATKEYVGLEYPAVADMTLIEKLVQAARAEKAWPLCGIARSHDAYYVESPAAQNGADAAQALRKLGVVLVEHELSSMFVVSAILQLRCAGIYVVEENFADGTAADPALLAERLKLIYRIALRAITNSDCELSSQVQQ